MSWWNAKYKNNHGEYEITFASKDYEKTKVVEKVCQAIIDKRINTDNTADFVERLIKDSASLRAKGEWVKTDEGEWLCSHCKEEVTICDCGKDRTYRKPYCPNCGADMRTAGASPRPTDGGVMNDIYLH